MFKHYKWYEQQTSLTDRLNNLKYKIYYPAFKLAPYSRRSNEYFWGYVQTQMIPKLMGIRSPAQILFRGANITLYSIDDLEFLDRYSSLPVLKIKRILRFAEEIWGQGELGTYRELAYLSLGTKASISRWAKDCATRGFCAIPWANRTGLPTRKSYIAERIIIGELLNKQRTSSVYSMCWDTYSTWSEIIGITIELMLCTLAIHFNNKGAKALIDKLIPNKQYAEYIILCDLHKNLIIEYFKNFFEISIATSSPLEILCKAIAFMDPGNSGFKKVAKRISKGINFHKKLSRTFNLNNNTVIFKLKDNSFKKHRILIPEALKFVSIEIINMCALNEYKGTGNRDIIRERVKCLQEQAQTQGCHITQEDICFLASISREVYRNI
jgi:hypothetical protein